MQLHIYKRCLWKKNEIITGFFTESNKQEFNGPLKLSLHGTTELDVNSEYKHLASKYHQVTPSPVNLPLHPFSTCAIFSKKLSCPLIRKGKKYAVRSNYFKEKLACLLNEWSTAPNTFINCGDHWFLEVKIYLRKYWETEKSFLIDPLTRNNAMYRDTLTLIDIISLF